MVADLSPNHLYASVEIRIRDLVNEVADLVGFAEMFDGIVLSLTGNRGDHNGTKCFENYQNCR